MLHGTVEYNEVPNEVCAATETAVAALHLLARYQTRLIPTSLYSVEILPPLK
jgi:hypothetical protein